MLLKLLALLRWLQAAPRRIKQLGLLALDGLAFLAIFVLAHHLRFGWSAGVHLPPPHELLIWLMVALGLSMGARVYATVVRAHGERYVSLCMLVSVSWVAVAWGIGYTEAVPAQPRSILVMTGFFWFLHLWLSRALIRRVVLSLLSDEQRPKRLMIYGAGAAGQQLMGAVQGIASWKPMGFFDDSPELIGTRVMGLPVFAGEKAGTVIAKYRIDELIVAIPTATKAQQQGILNQLTQAAQGREVHLRILPGLDHIVGGQLTLSDTREVDILDLLGREPVPVNRELFEHHVKDRVVLVTGAAGSIGSELCRQLLTAGPELLLVLDHSEFGLYDIERELRQDFPQAKIMAVLGSVMDQARMRRLLKRHQVETVYHAAAYKHVPMVEANPFEGVHNNALGTYRTALAAREAGVETFVLISTDKAVRPTNVMGASKRLSELVLQALAAEPIRPGELGTVFSMVRFGNVLGSSGSVVPVFREQIRTGGPLTITHPDITRYFMTIPEAAQLVIQAGGMGQGGDVFLLEMGEPVRIADLARNMIRLAGLTERTPQQPDGDIEITFSGLRPGEKLYEELLIAPDEVTPTPHPRIYRAKEPKLSLQELVQVFDEIEQLAQARDTLGLKRLLQRVVPGYVPDFSTGDWTSDDTERCVSCESMVGVELVLSEEEPRI